MQQYFMLVYGQPTQIALFGPNETSFITIGEGVKQGYATSSLLFCLGVDIALARIRGELANRGITAEVYMYMDDLTVCVDARHANQVTDIVIAEFGRLGLKVNESKSKILTDAPGTYNLPVVRHNEEFIVLGANVADSEEAFRQFIDKLMDKQRTYFELLRTTHLHDQVRATLLRICGFPRIHYHCSTTPPDMMRPVTEF